jgi:hypothetical protein
MGVDKVEAATTEGTPGPPRRRPACAHGRQRRAPRRLRKRMHVLDQVAHKAARRRVGLGRVHVGETEHIHPTLSSVWRVTGCAAAHARPRGLSAPAVALSRV